MPENFSDRNFMALSAIDFPRTALPPPKINFPQVTVIIFFYKSRITNAPKHITIAG